MASARSPLEAKMFEAAYRRRKGDLLKERDLHIAKNIDRSLKEGDLGILFIGATHRVEENLPKDIEVERLEGIVDTAARIPKRFKIQNYC